VDLAAVGEALDHLLDSSEHKRARAIVRARERALWARGRGVLRELLGRYLRTDPRELVLLTGERGKLELERAPLEFNLSHSAGLALYAFATFGPVGIDVELLRDPARAARSDYPALARRAFGAAAARRLRALEPESRELEFMRLWTRHEAGLKQRGAGLGAGRPALAPSWEAELDLGPHAVASLAAGRAPCELRLWRYEPGGPLEDLYVDPL